MLQSRKTFLWHIFLYPMSYPEVLEGNYRCDENKKAIRTVQIA
jgi:hypothetical protein